MGDQINLAGLAPNPPRKRRKAPRRRPRTHVPDPGWIESSRCDLGAIELGARVPALCCSGWRMRRVVRNEPVTCKTCLGLLFDRVQYRNFLVAAGWVIP